MNCHTDFIGFRLPGLAERPEDIEPNLDYELDQFARRSGLRATLGKETREAFLAFACSPSAKWSANFRDLNACVTRMATLSRGGRITREVLEAELERLRAAWSCPGELRGNNGILAAVLSEPELAKLDLFDRAQLAFVVGVCRDSATISGAGRKLFGVSREKRKVRNDSDRLRKYLARFGLDWAEASGVARARATHS
jgi:transcriptional regulatory protein RtcR